MGRSSPIFGHFAEYVIKFCLWLFVCLSCVGLRMNVCAGVCIYMTFMAVNFEIFPTKLFVTFFISSFVDETKRREWQWRTRRRWRGWPEWRGWRRCFYANACETVKLLESFCCILLDIVNVFWALKIANPIVLRHNGSCSIFDGDKYWIFTVDIFIPSSGAATLLDTSVDRESSNWCYAENC